MRRKTEKNKLKKGTTGSMIIKPRDKMHIWRKSEKKKNFQTYRVEGAQNWPRKKRFFLPGRPLLGPEHNFSYLGFPGSVLGNSKYVGPGCDLSGHIFSVLWPVMIIQYRCDTSRDVIWRRDFGPTAPLRYQIPKTLYLTSVRLEHCSKEWRTWIYSLWINKLSVMTSYDNPELVLHLTWHNM